MEAYDKLEIKRGYSHYFAASPKSSYPEGFKHHLITSVDKFEKLLNLFEDKVYVAADLETSSLHYEEAEIAGIGLCCEENRSFYLPFNHKVDSHLNLPKELIEVVFNKLIKPKKTIWFNYPFDASVLNEAYKFDIEDLNYLDAQIVVWLTDTNWAMPSLDWAAMHFFGWDLPKYEEVVGAGQFSFISPLQAKFYACSDPLANFHIFKRIYPAVVKECPFIMKLDNKVQLALIRAQQEDHFIDEEAVIKAGKEISRELPGLEEEIYKEAGYSFKIGSHHEVGRLFAEKGIDTGYKNKNGLPSTKADYLDHVDHPLCKKIVQFRKMAKWHSAFVEPLLKCVRSQKKIRFKYYTCAVPTGRFKSGKDRGNDYFAPLNIQAILKPKMVKKFAHDTGDFDQGIIGWIFDDNESDRLVEIPNPVMNIRAAFAAPKGFLFVRMDYSGQELRIPANLSGEQTWINTFNTGGDIHAAVAKDVFGKVDYNLRQATKAINFGIIYGSSPQGYAARNNIPVEEAKEFYDRYQRRHPKLFAWIKRVKEEGRRAGVVYTPFGRPRRLRYFFAKTDYHYRGFAERSCVNSIVQGGAADIFRIAFVNFYHNYLKKYPNDIKLQMVVHDEIDFIIKKSSFDMVTEIKESLCLKRKDWPVAMDVGIEFGSSWGNLIEFELENGKYMPVVALR